MNKNFSNNDLKQKSLTIHQVSTIVFESEKLLYFSQELLLFQISWHRSEVKREGERTQASRYPNFPRASQWGSTPTKLRRNSCYVTFKRVRAGRKCRHVFEAMVSASEMAKSTTLAIRMLSTRKTCQSKISLRNAFSRL